MNKKYFSYLIGTFSYLLISILSNAQTNAPSGATQVPAPTVTPIAAPTGYGGISNFNHIRTWEPQQPYQDPVQVMLAERKPEEVLQSVQYFDGMGRPLQTVAKQVGPAAYGKQDAVSPVVYDAYGRVAQQYLPYMSGTNDGKIKTNPFSEQNTFYNSTYVTDQPSLTGEKVFYSQIQYEASPLNRVQASFAPGNSWAGNAKGNMQQTSLNTDADSVVIWKVPCDNAVGDDKNLPYSAGRYSTSMLIKQIIKDEQGKTAIIYIDSKGHTILKKIQYNNTPSSGHSGWVCTYYVYDEQDLLRCMIQPQAVQYMNSNNSWTLSSTILTEQCFRYEYDNTHHCIAKKIPGAAWLYMVYDSRDRLVFSQDGNLRKNNQWNTTLYDELNRPITTGITTYTGTWQNLIDYVNSLSYNTSNININGTGPSTIPTNLTVSERQNGRTSYQASVEVDITGEFTSEDKAEFTAEIVSPTNSNFTNSVAVFNNPVPSIGTFTPLTIAYYDDYSFTTNTYDNSDNSKLDAGSNSYANPLPNTASNNTYGKPTGTKIRVLEDVTDITKGAWLTTVYYYDDKGRAIQVQADNYKGGKDIFTTRYNFVGNTVCTYSMHNNPAAAINNLTIQTNYDFDHAGRLLKISKKINDDNNTKRTIAQYTYDHMGKLKTKSIGQKRNDDASLSTVPIDNIDYNYNIRGWLTGINAAFTKSTTDNSKYFGEQLNYDWGMQNNQYNGNIAGTQWKTKGSGVQRAFGYGYDNNNQLLFADFNQNYNDAWGKTAAGGSIDFSTIIGDGKNANTAYDQNGNTLSMKQWGLKLGGSSVIDNLQYSYNANGLSNKLDAVTEDNSIGNTDNKLGDFTDGNRTGSDYSYDDNGNLLIDNNKNISSISYNYLDLPSVITVKDKGTISYIYDALGNKLEKQVHELPTTANGNQEKNTITTYIENYIYENNILRFIGQEEGRIRAIYPINGSASTWAYDYVETDHLGNSRVLLTDEYQKDQYPTATMETANAAVENNFYSNIESTRAPRPSGFNDVTTNPNNYVAKLRGDGNKIGPGIILKVMAGDKVSMQVNSWYDQGGASPSGNNSIVNDIIGILANQIPASSGNKIGGGTIDATILQNPVSAFSALVSSSTNTITNKPKAHLNYVLLDEAQLSYIAEGSGCKQVGDDKILTTLSNSIDVPRNGYLYIYTSNETQNIDVYFDNLQVTHTRGPLLEETHYYSNGLQIASLHSKAAGGLQNRFTFQGQEYEGDLGLNLYAFKARQYDAQIGRWHVPDPLDQFHNLTPYAGMGNKWVNGKDPNGKWFGLDDIIVSAVGFVVGYVSYGITKGDWGGKALATGLAGAAIAEGSYLTLGGGLVASSAAGVGGTGSIAASQTFAANYVISDAFSLVQNKDQIHNASDWGAFGLISGYSLFAGVQAGFKSDYMNKKIDNFLDMKIDDDLFPGLYKGIQSNGLGGLISNAGKQVLSGYDPINDKWNLNPRLIFSKALTEGYGGGILGKFAINITNDIFNPPVGTDYGAPELPNGLINSFPFIVDPIVQFLNMRFWESKLP